MMDMELRTWIEEDAIRNYEYDLNDKGSEGMAVDYILLDYIREAIDGYEIEDGEPIDLDLDIYDKIYDEAEKLYGERVKVEAEWEEEAKYWN